ncbi:MAG: hypothetical protein OXF82_00535 [Gammaproteobacteria bacterium]|nr:hypothetical protein [Gammaproteobacteria bacterium]
MKLALGALLLCAAGMIAPTAYASGSILAGGGISPRDAYTLGKALTFQKLVCASCPLQAADLDRDRAESLRASLEARDAAVKPGTPDDRHILVLCPATEASGCDSEVDEQELVHYYLTRRFRL